MMRLKLFAAFLIGLIVLIASVLADDRRVAVAFVDVKFDDKVAVWSLLLDQRYSKVVAITTGIDAHGKAAHELETYLEQQNAMANVRFDSNKIQVLAGSNGLGEPAPHEEWWKDGGTAEVDSASEARLQRALHGNKVRVFQIAPTHPELVQRVINAADPDSIDAYMLLHGYNSKQVNMEWQTYFLRNLRSWVLSRNPRAEVYFTSSFDSYAAKNGGKQLFSEISRMSPARDVEQAMRDPFWSRQLLRAYEKGLTPTPFVEQDAVKLDNIIYNARTQPEKYQAWRDHIANYIQNKVLGRHPPRRAETQC